ESIDELLLVQGVTPALLYGEDANRNGLLDPNENDGDQSPPLDNADGVLDHGWVAFLTAHSREANRRADGRKKIYINNNLLTDLFDELEEEFGIEAAKFVVAYRINGPVDQPPPTTTETSDKASEEAAKKKDAEEAIKKLVESITKNVLTKSGTVTRGGIDLSGGGKTTIKTIWELIDSRAAARVDGIDTILNNGEEWTAEDPSAMQTLLPKLMDALTTSEEDYIDGRINLNQARPEILKGLPGMDEELWNKIILAQKVDASGQPDPDTIQRHNTAGWLLAEGLVDKWKMRELDPYLTARGSVFRAQVFGFFDGGGPVTRLEVMVDSTKNPPRVTFQRDLNNLGHGYARGQLLPVTK
ncbi:MAG: hypothetical protein H7062_01620, partial [Candidatus Saccharimonas sp.]|nr:hypothetical protein [Planctomycetaceae bacterium]